MNIAVFGLGYVGCVSIGCLSQNGHHIIGVDISDEKIDLINKGIPTIIEKDIDKIILQQWSEGKIRATKDYNQAVLETDIAFICVGTPASSTGQLNLEYVYETARQIGESLKQKEQFYVVVIRSTVLPGTNQKIGEIIGKASSKVRNVEFAVISNPEFLREGSAVEDYYNPSVTVLGSDSEKALDIIEEVYKENNAPIVRTNIRAAEIIKYVNNAFHALKISFSNEIGNICQEMGIDSFKVMELFKMDHRLNISPAYFNPGMAYGGSCLPKDLRGLTTIAHDYYLKTPVISAVEESNKLQKEKMLTMVEKLGKKKIGIYGLAFKKGTDDLRYSPAVELAESLIGRGYDLRIFDRNVIISQLTGANKSYIEHHLPHIAGLLNHDLETVLTHAETMVFVHRPDKEDIKALGGKNFHIIDFVKIEELRDFESYRGIGW